jgi:4-alpha-glucanotransferase/(1->4)-alpha-D-glucan 1-alpha-D-glucosylmutase
LAGFWSHRDIALRKSLGLFDNEDSAALATNERRRDKAQLLAILRTLGLLSEEWDGSQKDDPKVGSELHSAIVGFLALTPAKLFILSQEDLFKELEQQNLPGTTSEYPNWLHKMAYSVDELHTHPEAKACCKMFRGWIDKSGRWERR